MEQCCRLYDRMYYCSMMQLCIVQSVGQTDCDVFGQDGWTALYFASKNGHVEVVKELLSRSEIDVNIQTKVSIS